MTFKDRGIILKESLVGEADKIVTALLYGNGKLSLSVKGARKPGSKHMAAVQPFCLSDFVIFEGKGFFSATQADPVENFFGLRDDFEAFCYASFCAEMADRLIYPDMPAENVIDLLCAAFNAMTKKGIAPKLAATIFEFKIMQLEGYAPEIWECIVCGEEIVDFNAGIHFGSEGAICENCTVPEQKTSKFTETARYAIDYILNSDIKNLFTFILTGSETAVLYNAAEVFRSGQLNISFKSLELLQF